MKHAYLLIGFVMSSPAAAHEAHSIAGPSWDYPTWCCAGSNNGVAQAHTGDCQAIPAASVQVTRDGFVLNLKPGDHHLITRPARHIVPYGNERRSEDQDYHLCLYPREDDVRCFFSPDQGS